MHDHLDIFSGRVTLKQIKEQTFLGGYDGLLPRKLFENFRSVMAISVLFEQFSENFVEFFYP